MNIWGTRMHLKTNFLVMLLTLFLVSGHSWANEDKCRDKSLVVLGDSLVAGYGLNPGEAFPEQLAEALAEEGYSLEIVNAGVSGDTTSGGLSRLDWSVPDGTDGVILELGANDALRGISPEVSASNLNSMIERLRARNVKVLLAGMLAPPNMGEAYQDSFNSIYAELADKHGVLLYPFFLDGVAGEPNLNQPDGRATATDPGGGRQTTDHGDVLRHRWIN